MLVPLIVAALGLCAYLVTMPRSITLEDAGLFQMVCTQGGLAHPPGYPLFTLICQVLPTDADIFYGNLISAIFAVLTLVLFYFLIAPHTGSIIAGGAALTYGFSLTFWNQAIIIEVYTLAALLFFLTWWLLEAFSRQHRAHYLYLSAFAFGLGLANHWPLMLLATPGLMVAALPALKHILGNLMPALILRLALALAAGCSPYLLLLTADDTAFGVFGHITSASNLVEYIARSFYADVRPASGFSDTLAYFAWIPQETALQFGLPVTIASLAGFIIMFNEAPRSFAWASLINFVTGTFLLIALLGFNFDAPDKAIFRPYPIIAYASVVIWLGFLIRWLAEKSPKPAITSVAITATFVVIVAVENFARVDRHDDNWVEAYFTSLLEAVPADGILFTDGDILSFPLGYLHYVKGLRPDITLYNWSSLTFPNRLSPPLASMREKEQQILALINTTERPVAMIEPRAEPLTRLGILNLVRTNAAPATRLKPHAVTAASSVLTRYQNDGFRYQQEWELADFVIASFTRLFIIHQRNGGEFSDAQQVMFRNLLATFPAQMVVLEDGLENNLDKQFVKAVFASASAQSPNYLSKKNQARLLLFGGAIQLMAPAEPELSAPYLKAAIDIDPTAAAVVDCLDQLAIDRDGPPGKCIRVF